MLERLDDVPWSTLGDALDASAAAVPALIRALAGSDKRKRSKAFLELSDERLVHQGQRFEASAAAAQFIVELVGQPSVEDKPKLLLFLALLAVGLPDLYVVGDLGVFPTLEAVRDEPGPYGRSYRAVEAGVPKVRVLLDDVSADVRAYAAFVLSFLPPSPTEETAVVGRLAREKVERVRISLLLCMANWGQQFGWRGTGTPLAAFQREKDGPTKLAAAIAVAATGTSAPGEVVDALVDGTRTASAIDKKQPFLTGDLSRLASVWLRRIAPGRALTVLTQRLESAPQHALEDIADLVALIFPSAAEKARRTLPGSYADLPIFAELAPDRQQALIAAARSAPDGEPTCLPEALARATGLPKRREELRRYVGLLPPTAMEQPLSAGGETLPAIHWLKRFALGALAREELVHLLAELPAQRAVEMCIEMVRSPYDLAYTGSWDWVVAVNLGLDALAARDDIEQELIAAGERIRVREVYKIWLIETLLTRICRRHDRVIPVEQDRLVSMLFEYARPPLTDLTREIVAALPSERRDPLLLAAPLVGELEQNPRVWDRPVEPRVDGWATLDLCSDKLRAAQRAVDIIAPWTATVPRPERIAEDKLVALGREARSVIDARLPNAADVGKRVLEAARNRISP